MRNKTAHLLGLSPLPLGNLTLLGDGDPMELVELDLTQRTSCLMVGPLHNAAITKEMLATISAGEVLLLGGIL